MLDVSSDDILDGPIHRVLLVLATPLLAQNVVGIAQITVDIFWVGQLGGEAVAAVGLAAPILGLVFGVASHVPFVGTQVVVSQRVGSEDPEGARRAAFAGVTLALVLGVVLGAAMFLNADAVVGAVTSVQVQDVDRSVASLTVAYLGVLSFGIAVSGMSDAVEAAFIGWGDSRASLYMNVCAVVTDVVLDPVFIFGLGPVPALGIRGAALASVLGYVAGFLFGGLLFLRRRTHRIVSLDAVTLDPAEYRKLVDIGAPSAVQRIALQFARVVFIVLVFSVGGAAGLAAYTIGSRVSRFATLPAEGLQQAAQSMVGQNLGANQPGRARRVTWTGTAIAVGVLSAAGVVQWVVPEFVTTLIVSGVTELELRYTVEFLRIFALGYPALGAYYLLRAGFNGAGRTRTTMVASILLYWVFRLPVAAAVVALGYGVTAVFWTITFSNVAVTLGLAAYYYHATSHGLLVEAVDAADRSSASE